MEEVTINVKVPLYGLESVYKACYSFLEKAYVRLEGDPEGTVIVRMRPKPESKNQDLRRVSGEFENELLHQALRLKVAAANGKIREYIVTRALASAEGVPAAFAVPQPAETPEPVLDAELEKEIEKLLAEVDREGGDDPLKIVAPHPGEASAPAEGK